MAMRFNPPPNWPPPPAGWQPPSGWEPDPSWPPEPPGWQLWVDDTPSTPSAAGFPLAADAPTQVGHQIPTAQPYASPQQPYTSPQQPYASPQQPYTSPQQPYASPQQPYSYQAPGYSNPAPGTGGASTGLSGFSFSGLTVATRWALGGGLALFIGALLPFIAGDVTGDGISGGARFSSALFGLILAGLGVAAQFGSAKPGPKLAFGIILLCLSALGLLGYLGFTAIGAIGISQSDGFETIHETFSPNIGLILSLLGCIAAGFAGFQIIRQRPAS